MQKQQQIVAAVILFGDNSSCLLQHRDDKPGLRRANMWVFPGGHLEHDETVEAAAYREFLEETDYKCGNLRFLGVVQDKAEDGVYPLHLFWDYYDGVQPYKCLEGQALEFVKRSEVEQYLIPYNLIEHWDWASSKAALEKSSS